MKIIYIAGVVQEERKDSLKAFDRFNYPNKYAHHMTIKYGGISELPDFIGREFTFEVERMYQDPDAIAVTGKIDDFGIAAFMDQYGQKAHITIATAQGVPPVYSNELISTNYFTELKTKPKIKLKVGAYVVNDNGENEWIFEKENQDR